MASTPKGSMCLDQRFCSKAGSSAGPSIQELVLEREETPSGLGISEVLALDQPRCPLKSNRHSQKRGVQHMSMERSERRRGTMCPMERASPRNDTLLGTGPPSPSYTCYVSNNTGSPTRQHRPPPHTHTPLGRSNSYSFFRCLQFRWSLPSRSLHNYVTKGARCPREKK